MSKQTNVGQSALGLSGNAGKGDADRSPGWRKNYADIDWEIWRVEGFVKRGNKYVKHYTR